MKTPQINKVTARILVEQHNGLTFEDLREANLSSLSDVPISKSDELLENINKLEEDIGELNEEPELMKLRKKQIVEKV
jgi:hypothetical protein